MRHVPIILAIIALFSWGLWVFFANLAGETLSGEMIVIITFFVDGMVGIGYGLIWGSITNRAVNSSNLCYHKWRFLWNRWLSLLCSTP